MPTWATGWAPNARPDQRTAALRGAGWPGYRVREDEDEANVILLVIPAALVAVVVGLTFGWKYVLAPMLGYAIFRWATGTLRSMVNDGRARVGADEQQPRPVAGDERVIYWCEECGTELVLFVRGSGAAPRHCAATMHERAELLSN